MYRSIVHFQQSSVSCRLFPRTSMRLLLWVSTENVAALPQPMFNQHSSTLLRWRRSCALLSSHRWNSSIVDLNPDKEESHASSQPLHAEPEPEPGNLGSSGDSKSQNGGTPNPRSAKKAPASRKKHNAKRDLPQVFLPSEDGGGLPSKCITQEQALEIHDSIATFLSQAQLQVLIKWMRHSKNLKQLPCRMSAGIDTKLQTLWSYNFEKHLQTSKRESDEEEDAYSEAVVVALAENRLDRGKSEVSELPLWVFNRLKSALINENSTVPWTCPIEVETESMENYQDNVELLMKARETVLRKSYAWSAFQEKIDSMAQDSGDEGDENKFKTIEQRQLHHNSKSQETLREEAEEHLRFLARSLPNEHFKAWFKELNAFIRTESNPKHKRAQKAETSFINTLVLRCVNSHIHLVAHPIAQFFYLHLSPFEKAEKRLVDSRAVWEARRAKFSMRLVALHQFLCNKRATSTPASRADKKNLEVDIVPQGDRPRVRRFHLTLDTRHLTKVDVSVPNVDKMVIVDNLPIDMTELELMALYSRCGPIAHFKIFNNRPDLDPGPLNTKQLRERRSRERSNRQVFLGTESSFPRTPLYALITFATEEGHQRAMDSSLQLFGMVVRKHAMRSHDVTKRTTLFVDHIPPGVSQSDLNYELSKALEDYVYVWVNRQPQRVTDVTSCEIHFDSFELAYTCSDLVRETFQRLSDGALKAGGEEEENQDNVGVVDKQHQHGGTSLERMDGSSGLFEDGLLRVTVNFLKTPDDAFLFWTRRKGFD